MRLILDTNVWSEIGRRDTRGDLEAVARAKGWKIRTPPATLLEVMRTTDPVARLKIVEALSSPEWRRLPSEADSESREFVAEAKRLRPAWVRQVPFPGNVQTHRDFWIRKAWREARRDPEKFARSSSRVHGDVDRHVAGVARVNRRFVAEQAPRLRDIDRWIEVGEDTLYIEHSAVPVPSRRVEAWRYKCREVFLALLQNIHAKETSRIRRDLH